MGANDMSLLTIAQNAARKLNIAAPATVVGNADLNAALLLYLAQEEGDELSRRHDWQALTTERTFTSLAAVIQTGFLPSDYDRLVFAAEIWDRSRSLKFAGPTPSRAWQQLQTSQAAGVVGWWRILADQINIFPAQPAGNTLAFEYVSKNWCATSGGSPLSAWAADTDVGRISERLMTLGIVWRWLRAKGMDYAEEMSTYEREVEKVCSRDRGAGLIRPPSDPGGDYPPSPGWSGIITP
jgi:hypothetical protein